MEAHDLARASSAASLEQLVVRLWWHWDVLQQSWKVIREEEGRLVLRILLSILSGHARAKRICWIELRQIVLLRCLLLT